MDVGFIVHGNAQTGMGHVMRSLSLAEALKGNNHGITFFSKYPLGINLIAKNGYKVVRMPFEERQKPDGSFFYGNPDELEGDLEFLSNHLNGITDVLIVDSYNVTEHYFSELRKKTKCLVYIDDLNAFHYPVDIILNGSASAFQMGYEKNQTAKLLLGTEYMLLRKEFWNVPKRTIHPKIENILVTTGNSDPFHVTERILHFALEDPFLKTLHWHAIIGSGFSKDIWSDERISRNKTITLYDSPQNMKDIMLDCDMAVTAGGSTTYELAACGIPMAVFIYAENQRAHVEMLERKRLIDSLGSFESLDYGGILTFLKRFDGNIREQERRASELKKLVDGKGPCNAAEGIESLRRSLIGK